MVITIFAVWEMIETGLFQLEMINYFFRINQSAEEEYYKNDKDGNNLTFMNEEIALEISFIIVQDHHT